MIYLFITHQFMMGGVEKVFLNIASQLSDRKIYLLLTCQNYDQDLLAQIPSNVSLIENDRFKIDGVKSFGNLFLLARQVNKKLADISEDLCCVNFSDTFSTFLLSLLIKAKKHICWCHSNPRMVYKRLGSILSIKNCSASSMPLYVCVKRKKRILPFVWE